MMFTVVFSAGITKVANQDFLLTYSSVPRALPKEDNNNINSILRTGCLYQAFKLSQSEEVRR